MLSPTFELVRIVLISIVIIVSVITDLRTRRIYNKVTFPAIAIGILLNTFVSGITNNSIFAGFYSFLFSFTGLLVGIFVFFLFFTLGWFGGGDAKLMGAIGAFMGPRFTLWCVLFTLVAGGIISLFLITIDITKRNGNSQIVAFFSSLKNKILYSTPVIMPDKKKSGTFTYSLAIAAGFITTIIFINNGYLVL